MQMIQAKLSDLKVDPANVRKTDIAPDETLISSIRAKGIIVPLTVRRNGNGFYVTDGGKRLASLQLLARDGDIDKSAPINCMLREDDDAAAADISLTANFVRESMHPVDEYEAFAKLLDAGKQPKDIATEYGLPVKFINQSLALGKLAPEVREAWRKGELNEDAAQAFTLEPDQARQAELLARLKKKAGLQAWTVKSAIVGDERGAPNMLKFVGVDAYKAAGGAIIEDLFAEQDDQETIACDTKLLTKLFEQKLKEKKAELEAEGWKWVAFMEDLSYSANYWPSKAKSQIKAGERDQFGVIISVNSYHKDIEIRYGVQKPAEQKAAEKKKVAAKGETVASEPSMSAALAGRISEQITQAAAAVLKTDSNLGLAATVAACLTGISNPLSIRHEGSDFDTEFSDALGRMRKKTATELHRILAELASAALGLGGSTQNNLPLAEGQDDDQALLNALDQKKLNSELRKNFDAADYFSGMTAQVARDAITACDPKYPFTGKEKKSDLAKVAAELVKKSNAGGKAGYLPPEMRLKSYDGPSAKKAAAPAKPVAKKTTKKKAA